MFEPLIFRVPHARFSSVGLFVDCDSSVAALPTTTDSVTMTYDALGRAVEMSKTSGSYIKIVYGPTGNKLALMDSLTTIYEGRVPLPGGGTAIYNYSGVAWYRHADWLGSSRFGSTPTQTLYNDLAFAPFGEVYASTGSVDESFAGSNEDTSAALYDAQYREYGIQGRWPSPDPAGMAAANPANPQSWNRYAYVMNNPLLSRDPTGFGSMPCLAAGMQRGLGAHAYCIDTPFGGGSGDDGDGGGGGGIGMESTFGCTEFDVVNPSSGCAQAQNWFVNPNWTPWDIQYKGPASDGQTVTFDNWLQYANWRTTVAAGAPDPCVYLNDSATGVQDIDVDSNPIACENSPGGGGNWVPAGFGFHVDQASGTLVVDPPGGPLSLSSSGTYSAYLGCVGGQWYSHFDEWGTAAATPIYLLGAGQIRGAYVALGVDAVVDLALALEIRQTCTDQVNGTGP